MIGTIWAYVWRWLLCTAVAYALALLLYFLLTWAGVDYNTVRTVATFASITFGAIAGVVAVNWAMEVLD